MVDSKLVTDLFYRELANKKNSYSQTNTPLAVFSDPPLARPIKLKTEPFVRALGSLNPNSSVDEVIEKLGKSSPIYQDMLRDKALLILQIANAPMTITRLSSKQDVYLLANRNLAECIPAITGKRKARYFLSAKGFALIDHWHQRFERFRPYYNAFVREAVREKANQFLVIRKMGGVPGDIQKANKENEEIDKALNDMRQKHHQFMLEQQQKVYQQAVNPSYLSGGSGVGIGTGLNQTITGSTTTWMK